MCSSPHWQVGSSWFREKLSPANRNKGYRGEQISRKIVSRELNARSYRDFAKNIALLGAMFAKFAKSVGQKIGSNMRPRYIQFRDIHDRDISGFHCIEQRTNLLKLMSGYVEYSDSFCVAFLRGNAQKKALARRQAACCCVIVTDWCSPFRNRGMGWKCRTYQWLSARLWYLQCISNRDTAGLY